MREESLEVDRSPRCGYCGLEVEAHLSTDREACVKMLRYRLERASLRRHPQRDPWPRWRLRTARQIAAAWRRRKRRRIPA